MQTYSLSPWDNFFVDLYNVGFWVINRGRSFLQQIYANDNWNFLFYTALLPFVLMFCADLIFTFIFSIRSRQLRFFNVLSPNSWRSLRDLRLNQSITSNRLQSLKEVKNYGRDIPPKYLHLSSLSLRLGKYRKAKAGDVVRCKDGERFVYVGMRLDAKNSPLYAYRGKNGVYYSTMKPSKWSASTGSQRGASIKMSYKNKK